MESAGKNPGATAGRSRLSSRPRSWSCASAGTAAPGQVARDFDLTETAVREWVKQAGRDAGTGAGRGLTSAGQGGLAQLRTEDRRLREDADILNRATAFFAKQTR
jgi:transposase